MHIGVFTYYYYPVINGVVLTIGDWKKQAQYASIPESIFTPQAAREKSNDPTIIEYPAIPIWQRFGITIPMSPQATIDREISKRNITLLHVHHPFYIGKLALGVKKKFHLPVVFTYHTRYGDYATTYFPFIPKRLVEYFMTRSVVRFMNECDAVTVANLSLKKELTKKGLRVPIFIVPPGIDTKKFSQGDRSIIRKQYGVAPKDQLLLYVGRLAKEKNIYLLLRSFVHIRKQVPRVRLLLAGKGLEEAGIRALARKNNMEDAVIIDGNFNPDTIVNAYAAADMFIYASQTETFGRVLVEAMAAGLPVVALNALSVSDLIVDGKNGKKVFRSSPRAFASVVVQTLANPASARAMGLRAQEDARRNYDNVASWKKLLHVYTVSQNRDPS